MAKRGDRLGIGPRLLDGLGPEPAATVRNAAIIDTEGAGRHGLARHLSDSV